MSEEFTTASEPTIESVNQSLMSIEEAMLNMDSTVMQTQDIRNQLIVKLLPDILAMDTKIDRTSDPDLVASQARMISEMRGLLNDRDNASKNHLSLKLKQKDIETQSQISFSAAEFLATIKRNEEMPLKNETFPMSEQQIADLIDSQFKEQGCVVLDTELEEGSNMLPEKKEEEE